MDRVITAEQLPRDEEIYFKKDWAGYRIVHPIKNKDGSINWINFLCGGKRNAVFMLVVILLIFTAMFAYAQDIKQYKEVVENPCAYCSTAVHNFQSSNAGLDNFIIENAKGQEGK